MPGRVLRTRSEPLAEPPAGAPAAALDGATPSPGQDGRSGSAGIKVTAALTAVAVMVAAVTLGAAALTAFEKTKGGEVAVIRNGGPFDDNRVRQVIPPASARTWTGLLSAKHVYPAQQRFYTITADAGRGDRSGVDVEHAPTADGVEVGVEGTLYFSLTSDPEQLARFDDRYGTRRYRGADGEYRYAWEGEEGWSTFLDQIVRPVISNDLREEIGSLRCAQLQASCALVQNAGQSAAQAVAGAAGQSNVNLAKVQDAINTSLAADLQSTLGGPFITDVRFNLVKIALPPEVQSAINRAQAAFAGVTEAQAKVEQARAEALANEQRQRGYSQCPACATIDSLRAIPPTVTTFAPGGGFSITQPAK